MKEALGGMFNYVILLTFVLLVTTFVLFGVNYYRAFSVKNKIITLIESYEGNLDNVNLKNKVEDYIGSLSYNIGSKTKELPESCNTEVNKECCIKGQGWCYKIIKGNDCTYIYEVRTFVNVDLPFFNKIFDSNKFFSVAGETKPIRRGNCS